MTFLIISSPVKVKCGSGNYEAIEYTSVNIDGLTADKLKTLLVTKNVQKPNVVNMGEYLLFSYENHLPLYIKKSDGKLYTNEDVLDYTQKVDAQRFLRILNSYGLVKDFKRKQGNSKEQYTYVRGWRS